MRQLIKEKMETYSEYEKKAQYSSKTHYKSQRFTALNGNQNQ